MQSKEQIGFYGTVSLIITLIITKLLISAPSLYCRQSASAGWLEVLISGIFEVFILCIVLHFLSLFENTDIIDIINHTAGKKASSFVAIIFCLFFTISGAAVFRSFAELIRNTVIRGMSYEIISVFLLAASIAAGYVGIKTLTNLNGLILPFILISLIIIVLINFPRHSLSNILPLCGNGITTVISNAVFKNASFYELGIILFFVPYSGSFKSVKKISFTALLISVLLSTIVTLFYQLSVPYETAATFSLPIYQMTRMIKAGTFFQRIEPLNMFIWSGALLIYVGLCIRMSAVTFRKAFNVSNTTPMIFVFSQIVCSLALIPGSETNVERIYSFILTYGYIAYPVLPLVLLIIAASRSTKRKRREL